MTNNIIRSGIAASLALASASAALSQTWERPNPGAGGQIQHVNLDPNTPGRIYLNIDVDGTYRSDDFGQSWSFTTEGTQHGMSFFMGIEPGNADRLYSGNLYGLDRSTDGGATWTPVSLPVVNGVQDEGDSIAWITIDQADVNNVYAAPGWLVKDGLKTNGSALAVFQTLSGPRTIYVSTDRGASFNAETYETTPGHRQVYTMAVNPNDASLWLGAHSGVYRRNGANNYSKLPIPTGTIDGTSKGGRVDGCRGIAINPDGTRLYALWTVDSANKYTKPFMWDLAQGTSGSWVELDFAGIDPAEFAYPKIDPRSTGSVDKLIPAQLKGRAGVWEGVIDYDPSPIAPQSTDGFESIGFAGGTNWVDSSWSTTGSTTPEVTSGAGPIEGDYHARLQKDATATRTVDLSGLSAPSLSFSWKIKGLTDTDRAYVELNDGSGWTTVVTADPAVVPDDSYTTEVIDLSGYTLSSSFQIRFSIVGGGNGDNMYFDDIVFLGDDGTPPPPFTDSWTQVGKKPDNVFTLEQGWETHSWIARTVAYSPPSWPERDIYASGGNSMFLGKTVAPGYPYDNAWEPIYTRKEGEIASVPTYASRGFDSTVNFDMAKHEQYLIQCMADQGALESWDDGLSWTKETRPDNAASRSNSALVVEAPSQTPTVLAHFTRGFGAVTNNGGLYAKPLVNHSPADSWTFLAGLPLESIDGTNTEGAAGTAGLVSALYEHIVSDPNNPERIYIAARENGIFYCDDIFSLINIGTPAFTRITSGTSFDSHRFDQLFVDPNDSNRLLMAGSGPTKGFFEGANNAGTWSFSQINLIDKSGSTTSVGAFQNIDNMYVWDHNGQTRVAIGRDLSASEGYSDIILSTDGGGSFSLAADRADFLAVNTPNWYDANRLGFNDPLPRAIVGRGDEIYAAVGLFKHRRSLGVLKGSINGSTVAWSDFTGTGNDRMFNARSERGRVITDANGDDWMYVATNGSGMMRVNLDSSGGTPGGSLISSDGFESGDFSGGSGWATNAWATSDNGDGTQPDIVSSENPFEGNYHLRLRKSAAATREVDLTNATGTMLHYSWKAKSLDGSEYLIAEVNDGSGWTTLFSTETDDEVYRNQSHDLSAYDGTASLSIRFRLEATGNGDYGYIDFVEVSNN